VAKSLVEAHAGTIEALSEGPEPFQITIGMFVAVGLLRTSPNGGDVMMVNAFRFKRFMGATQANRRGKFCQARFKRTAWATPSSR
jgi:hypothetical protein